MNLLEHVEIFPIFLPLHPLTGQGESWSCEKETHIIIVWFCELRGVRVGVLL
jgi:hypothetical protein